jgi:hypothetical protein
MNLNRFTSNKQLSAKTEFKTLFSTSSSLKLKQNKPTDITYFDQYQQNKSEITERIKLKPLKNEPFIKNLFRGIWIYDYLKFPEYDTNHELNKLTQNYIEPLKTFLGSAKYTDIIDATKGQFTQHAFDSFRQLNLFSNSISKEYDGQELDSTFVARMLEETAIYPALGLGLIYNNEIVAKSILMYGNQEQKNKYLKRLANGGLRAGFCFTEPDNGLDASRFKCLSTIKSQNTESDKQVYLLNGKKSWVTLLNNEENLDKDNFVFLVISTTVNTVEQTEPDINCLTAEDLKHITTEKCLNAFLVDKNTKGVKLTRRHTNSNGLNLYEIEFDNVELDSSTSMLGLSNNGFEISSKLIENARYLVGALSVGLLKNLYKTTLDFIINTKRFDKSLSEFLGKIFRF